ncbi:hypothetical protein [Methylosinus sporium]|uniref:hypothetical protein n=1 Tax=Methylosinus sporium TaxID=428 RepID=UPI00383A05AF
MMSQVVDVLLIAAVQMEFDAAKAAFTAPAPDSPGVANWSDVLEPATAPYLLGTYNGPSRRSFTVALARPTRMGSSRTTQVATILSNLLQPRCIVMCGVCAGNPSDLALGDVVLSELAYAYDEGKLEAAGFVGDHRQSPVSSAWLRAAQDLSSDGLPSHGLATSQDAEFWLLERLHNGADPRKHPARTRYFPEGAWQSTVRDLEARKLIERVGPTLRLTEGGIERINESLVYNVDPPKKLPFALKVGPFASGNVVVKDGMT